ncbi:hypothetical protein MMC24_003995 [Lignoscripta atroalba]|nr:hypothetical protein [Lignoscripta atroalba]
MISKLCTLAVELIELIAGGLAPADLFSLRLVCAELNKKTLYYFSHTYFTTAHTDLSPHSLQELKALSEHGQFGHHVQALLIEGQNDIGQGFWWNRHPSGHLVAPLPGVEMLRDILINDLTNCRSFRIYKKYEGEEPCKSDVVTGSDVVAIILTIIAETGLPVKSFSVNFRDCGTGVIDAKRLHVLEYQTPEFRTAWANLQELSLKHTVRSGTLDWTLELFLRATSLRKLTLNLDFDMSETYMDRLSAVDTFPKLQELSLLSIFTTEGNLSRFLLHFRDSLRTLSFWHVSILPGGTLVSAFRAMRSNLPLLESICVTHPTELGHGIIFPALHDDPVVPGTEGRRFELVDRRKRPKPTIVGASYRGPRMDVALEILARSAVNF